MARIDVKIATAVRTYFSDLRNVRATGGATGERSSYGPLATLLNAIGATLRPKVFCVGELADQGAGHPDFGLYTQHQVQRGRPRSGQIPERGVVEVKSTHEETQAREVREQVERYWNRYRLVLVTNLREFELVGADSSGRSATIESFRVADSEEAFDLALRRPRASALQVEVGLGEYLCRVLSHRSTLTDPKDLAWLLASYARDGLARVEAAGRVAVSLNTVRAAMEEALGVRFEGEKGARFFRSILVQTLFYGVFSAWVLWARQTRVPASPFRWREAVWHLRAPVLRALFQQLSDPGRLQPLGLVEVLDWTAAALDRVDHDAFFSRFQEGEAVPYFYEPFLAAFDPTLRKQLGVWYTPVDVVRYMVARVDWALKNDLGIADGLADENVYVLDPCCGTGAYLTEVIRRIAVNLNGRGLGALVGARVKQAAMERVFGFEIMPAPFVVAHLQVGITMQDLEAPLEDDGSERVGVFLTNALTNWEPRIVRPLPFPELAQERDRAEQVKQRTPILVVIGNPPYNGHPGVAVTDEERALSQTYRTIRNVRRPEGRGLNDLYVRFFRMAERRIAEMSGNGVICFISNYSWLEGLSFTGMRERFLEAFDVVRIDCLNGDKYKTGKIAPDGSPDPSIFSREGNRVGIQVGTAITTLLRKVDHAPAEEVEFRDLWGQAKLAQLTATAETEPTAIYDRIKPVLPLGLPFVPTPVSKNWFEWPALPELFPVSFPGVQTSRDAFLVDIDLDRLQARVADYFDASLSHDRIAQCYPVVMRAASRFVGQDVREDLLRRGGPNESGFVRYAYRPFDIRWLYWEPDTELIHFPVVALSPHLFDGNSWLVSQPKPRREWSPPQVISSMCCLDLMDRGANAFPMWLRDTNDGDLARRANLTEEARSYLENLGSGVEDLFHHVISVLHDPHYRAANRGALRMEWPRIPLLGWPDGQSDGASNALVSSAARGRELARLLNTEVPVTGITQDTLQPEIVAIAVPSVRDGRNIIGDDFAVTVGWGHFGAGQRVMPGRGQAVERAFTPDERAALGDLSYSLGETTFDIYLNERAYWSNVPAAVWCYKLGGYQVLKKWLSYRAHDILGRSLTHEEVQLFADTARRITAILVTTNRRNNRID